MDSRSIDSWTDALSSWLTDISQHASPAFFFLRSVECFRLLKFCRIFSTLILYGKVFHRRDPLYSKTRLPYLVLKFSVCDRRKFSGRPLMLKLLKNTFRLSEQIPFTNLKTIQDNFEHCLISEAPWVTVFQIHDFLSRNQPGLLSLHVEPFEVQLLPDLHWIL